MAERPLRLGDVIEDYCPRCRLLLNHDIAALSSGEIAKVTCRTCYNTHDFRHAQVPRKRPRKETKKSLVDQVLASLPVAPPAAAPTPPPAPPVKKKRDLWAEVERIRKSGK